jgi:endonuclease YncB( thermonuclease family)
MKRFFSVVLAASLFASPALSGQADVSGVIRVIDGDTLDVGQTRVRLHGIDAPEVAQTCTGSDGVDWACGAWVSAQVRASLEGRAARCDAVDVDRYGRVVARCFVGNEDVGQSLVRNGWAFAYRKYSTAYIGDEKKSARQKVGLHASRFQTPSEFRQSRTASGTSGQGGACQIKGNISTKGTRIYHSPGQRDYDKTRIDASKGERWFCTADEALSAGWRAARR